MLVMNERGMKRLIEDKFTLGANASVAAGPVGRSATAQTDAQLSAEILSWSRSKGLFVGIALEGATLRNDLDENQEVYGRKLHSKDILLTRLGVPSASQKLVSALNRYSRYEEKNKPIESRAADAVTSEAERSKEEGKGKKGATTMTGCLSKGDMAGEYVLTNEKTGRKTTVTGPADLEKHSAHHKVTLTGSRSMEGGKTVFKVTAIKHVSETCTPAAAK
jgi:hypothetical protein